MRGKKQRNDLKAFSFKLKLKDGDKFLEKPEFEVSERQGDKYVVLPDRESELSGNLLGVEPKEYVYNKSVIRSFTITLQDKDEIYFVNIPFNSLGRGLANSLLALKTFDDVTISLYTTKPKTEGGKSYAAASLRQNGEIVRWKFGQDELPKPEEVKFKGSIQRDYAATEIFLAEHLKELNKLVKTKSPASVTTSHDQPVTPEDKGEDVPF